MTDTYYAQGALKAASGKDQRGRKNNAPVLHYTLSWEPSDNPSRETMEAAALSSLKVIGLSEHEALIVAHHDKDHLHVHIVANTVHPQTGMTAPLKYTKLALSRWAEDHEREHGMHCDERVKNNAERDERANTRRRSASELLMAGDGQDARPTPPYAPVKHRAASRKQWFDKKEIVSRMKQMRAELDKQQKAERDAHWQRQLAERDELDARTEAAIDDLATRAKEHYRPHWRGLYRAQKREVRYLRELMAYEAVQKGMQPISARDAMAAAVSPVDRLTELKLEHEQARRALSRQQREDVKLHTDAIMAQHKTEFEILKDHQDATRKAERAAMFAQTRTVTFSAAKQSLLDEQRKAAEPRPFKRAPEPEQPTKAKADDRESLPTLEQRQDRPSERREAAKDFEQAAGGGQAGPESRADRIRRDMAEWRKRNQERDVGREM